MLLVSAYLPDWFTYVYVNRSSNVTSQLVKKLQRISDRVRVFYSNDFADDIPLSLLPYSALDHTDVTHLLVRSAQARLTSRDVDVVSAWMKDGDALLCSRDHPTLHNKTLVAGLLGFRPHLLLQKQLNQSMTSLITQFTRDVVQSQLHNEALHEDEFLNNFLLPRLQEPIVCFDSVLCQSEAGIVGGARDFPSQRNDLEFVGEKFSALEEPKNFEEAQQLRNFQRHCSRYVRAIFNPAPNAHNLLA